MRTNTAQSPRRRIRGLASAAKGLQQKIAVLAMAQLIALSLAGPATAATYTVTSEEDSGAGTLRQAILDANAAPGLDIIAFNHPDAGPQPIVIELDNDLPTITDVVHLKGYTQPGAAKATAASPAVPKIVIDAGSATNGLVIQTNDSRVSGLIVQSASGAPPDGDGFKVIGDSNRLWGNFIGVEQDPASVFFLRGNAGDGIDITGNDNTVGGTGPEDRNVIGANGFTVFGGNDADGVSIVGDGNLVHGNTIGTNPLGTGVGVGNSAAGVRISGDANRVGAAASGAQNLISGNGEAGVIVAAGSDNEIRANLIGTDSSGTRALRPDVTGSPGTYGVVVESSDNTVGGDEPGQGNVIAGAASSGVQVNGDINIVQGNLVGTDLTGTVALPNHVGITVSGSLNIIGGTKGNVVSGNTLSGISIGGISDDSPPPTFNSVTSNIVGLDATEATALSNGGNGVSLSGADLNNVSGNVIAHNALAGIAVESGTKNTIGGLTFANGGLGIDLGADGPTKNDAGDKDVGANDLINSPTILTAKSLKVTWTLSGLPNTQFALDFYDTAAECDEGQNLVGTATATTDKSGNARGTTVATATKGNNMTATATLTSGTSELSTSEFSNCVTIS